MGCATSVVKYLLFLFNFIFVLAAIAFIAVGVLLKINIDNYTETIENVDPHFNLAPILMIVVGVIVFVIAFFGCCGAIREGTCMLTTYAIILLTIFIVQVAIGVYAFVKFKDSDQEIRQEILSEMKKTMEQYDKNDVARESIDSLQYGLECCGAYGPNDWAEVSFGKIPSTCCRDKPDICPKAAAYSTGCGSTLFDFLTSSLKTIGIIVIVIGAIELGGAVVSLCLASSIRNYERRGGYA